MVSAVRPEFIRRVTGAPMQRMRTESENYWASLDGFAVHQVDGVLGFDASWRSRVMESSSGRSKELWKEESLMKFEAIPDSATIQFIFRKDSIKLSVNCLP